MEWDFIWKAILIVLVGTVLLRVAGRKTISQMTLAETVLMVGIGSLLIQPVAGKNVWTTFLIGGILVGTLLVMELLQMKSDKFEKAITGKAKIIIDNGNLNEQNLKKLRLSVDQLEMMLRQNSISKISDVKWATLEPNGQLGYELKQEAQPVTKKDFDDFKQTIVNLIPSNAQLTHINEILSLMNNNTKPESKEDIFAEVKHKRHKEAPPKHLQ
ncbi:MULTISPECIES: DUF421 domain-containing protein [Bacillaceae]|uniref:DUF421 domain-containing protein n=1 Tax=Bacillaceae TaxID=186817 RepID=UPI000BFD3A7A|nr:MULTISPECIES: DUF421 domain-containing protein [Bacillaceae]PGT84452.1 DUF421 domain-containing protein [Bacillus sp. AFS040349]UGB32950.1 DUF421 domain-containing protein [Metabacillus sp. B2-18]